MSYQERIKNQLADLVLKVQELRERVTEFQGLEREFALIQEEILRDYKRSSSIKHPGDRGAVREEICRKFLTQSGYLPMKYGVSKSSVRVVSQTGHQTEQIDIAVYDSLNSPTLISYSSVTFLAVESVYGVIQVKSRLKSKKDIKDGLRNIASFKRLEGISERFGILLTYECSLKWTTLVETIKEFMSDNPSSVWPNLIVVLNAGVMMPYQGGQHYFMNSDICKLSEPAVTVFAGERNTLLRFYLYLMRLLGSCKVEMPNLYQYVKLPFTSSERSYRFTYGELHEVGNCPKHGVYLRKVSNEAISEIVNSCSQSKPIGLLEVFSLATERRNEQLSKEEYESNKVYIYNPEDLCLSDILTSPDTNTDGLYFYSLTIEGEEYIIPFYYSIKNKLISECPKCGFG